MSSSVFICLLLADCIEKVDPAWLPMHSAMKAPFLHVGPSNLSPKPSAQDTDFNLRRALF
ncbi:hypothetical protein [Pseudomonas putida]|jgi:hypothetical protein